MPYKASGQVVPNDSEADVILLNLHALSDQIVTAWQERAIVLTAEEQAMLRREIHKTCKMLTNLTHSV